MKRIAAYLSDFNPANNFRMMVTNVRGDIVGGLTAGVIALPLALALGVACGLGAKAGLVGAMVLGLIAALLGGTPSQISGPTAPMTVIVASVVMAHTGQPLLVLGTIALAGLVQVVFAFTKIGRYIQYMPYPVISGFMTGIGIIILVIQINPFLGLAPPSGVESAVLALPDAVANLNPIALGIGLLTLILIYALPKLHPRIPGAIVGLAIGAIIAKLLGLDLPEIGQIPQGLPEPHLPPVGWDVFRTMIGPAATLAVIGLLDSLLTSLVADRDTKTHHNSHRELFGQGLGNFASGLFGGLPGAGATIRTEINIRAGGRTPLSGVAYAFFIFITILFLGQWLRFIPMACLAAVLFKAGIDIMDLRSIARIPRMPLFDWFVLIVVLTLTVAVNIMVAVGIGLLLACILFVKRMGDLLAIDITTLNDMRQPWVADDRWRDELSDEQKARILVFEMNGPLFFGASSNFLRSAEKHGNFAGLVLRMHRVPEIDVTGAYALEELVDHLRDQKKFLYISGMTEQPRILLKKLGIWPLIGDENDFRRFEQAANHAADVVRSYA
jgi:SulP family sulfate permease